MSGRRRSGTGTARPEGSVEAPAKPPPSPPLLPGVGGPDCPPPEPPAANPGFAVGVAVAPVSMGEVVSTADVASGEEGGMRQETKPDWACWWLLPPGTIPDPLPNALEPAPDEPPPIPPPPPPPPAAAAAAAAMDRSTPAW